ncbi:hypothetical protein [Pseudonocardia humida]|uniref:hypothetical protein n=1 Tax=Pseudonocardia humida TaxID=2800819 RepID=UPI00207D2314|nr:hypothetical protein [Pseudonocardia humida]
MGLSSTVWFVIAVVAVLAGAALLLSERGGGGSSGSGARDRKKWAALRGWEYLDSDPVLPSRWRYGTISQGGPGVARRLMSGGVPTPDGDRQAYVFDHEQAGRPTSVLVAVHVGEPLPAAVELRLPSAPLPDDAGLDLLEPVGDRYAFVADADAARPLLTPRLAAAADALGDDVELVWAEESWVLATAPLDSSTDRLQDLLADLAEVASVLEKSQAASRRGAAAETSPVGTVTAPPAPTGSTRDDRRAGGLDLVKRDPDDDVDDDEVETRPGGTSTSRDR